MAIWLTKSRTMTHYLKKKIGLMGIPNQTRNSQPTACSSSGIPVVENYATSFPHVCAGNSAFSFPCQRFKSTVGAGQLDPLYSSDDDNTQSLTRQHTMKVCAGVRAIWQAYEPLFSGLRIRVEIKITVIGLAPYSWFLWTSLV
ncbi:conserved hypothetical protein [Ricinus communis]|uniref:Uncharacterized protein n=1 Tax=Ricinus communis TaxID=3988 RepID=B9S2P4_RICCO|nr:conserved hypothetical protein [Ricinus communis]